jgi:hypothetical protein
MTPLEAIGSGLLTLIIIGGVGAWLLAVVSRD